MRYLECLRRFGPKFPLEWLRAKGREFSLCRFVYNEAEVHSWYLQELRRSALWGSLEVTEAELQSLEKIRVQREPSQGAEGDLTCADI